MLVHFQNLKDDLPGEIARVARFLGMALDAGQCAQAAERCSFGYMKNNAARLCGVIEASLAGGASSFFRKGATRDWVAELEEDDLLRYERAAKDELSAQCARWLSTGIRDSSGR
jgi:aryl sulfotransferase